MGLEDFRVVLILKPVKSVFPQDVNSQSSSASPTVISGRPTAAAIADALTAMGFVRQPAATQIGPARIAAPLESEIRMTARQDLRSPMQFAGPADEYIVEALIRGHRDGRTSHLLFQSLSMRFAICQPEGAAWHFLRLVKRVCDSLCLAVLDGDKTYAPEVFWAFRLRANEQIRSQEAIWSDLFEGDGERRPIAVEESWGHFLERHPGLLASAEATIAPGRLAVHSAAEPDMEATLPPKAKVAVPARRTSQ